jgi:hypothetical protein
VHVRRGNTPRRVGRPRFRLAAQEPSSGSTRWGFSSWRSPAGVQQQIQSSTPAPLVWPTLLRQVKVSLTRPPELIDATARRASPAKSGSSSRSCASTCAGCKWSGRFWQKRGLLRKRASLRFVYIDKDKAHCPIGSSARLCTFPELVTTPGVCGHSRRGPRMMSGFGDDPRRSREKPEDLREPAGARAAARARDLGEPQARPPADAQRGARARIRKRYRCTTIATTTSRSPPICSTAASRRQPNQRRVGDVTEILTGHGKLYLAVILDVFSGMSSAGRSPPRTTATLRCGPSSKPYGPAGPTPGCSTTWTRRCARLAKNSPR